MHDVIVSGAGPAGSLFALNCASKGLDVLVLEKGLLGRKKCCAGGLLERSLGYMGRPVPESLVERELTSFCFVVKGERFQFDLRRPLGIMVRREKFDFFLAKSAEKAGAQIMDGVKVLGANESLDRIVVHTSQGEVEAKYLAMAEGASSVIANQLLGRHPPHWSAMGSAIEMEVDSQPEPSMQIHLLSQDRRVLRPGPSFPFTGAVFPLKRLGHRLGGWEVLFGGRDASGIAEHVRSSRWEGRRKANRRGLLPSFAHRSEGEDEFEPGDRHGRRGRSGEPLLRRRALLGAIERLPWLSGHCQSMRERMG